MTRFWIGLKSCYKASPNSSLTGEAEGRPVQVAVSMLRSVKAKKVRSPPTLVACDRLAIQVHVENKKRDYFIVSPSTAIGRKRARAVILVSHPLRRRVAQTIHVPFCLLQCCPTPPVAFYGLEVFYGCCAMCQYSGFRFPNCRSL